jgi:SAM-dependent methyltransferase
MKFLKRLFSGAKTSPICPNCNSVFESFLPLPESYLRQVQESFIFKIDTAETLNIRQYQCPYCHSSDRDRLISLYLNLVLKKNVIKRIMHVAPAKCINKFIQNNSSAELVTVDLYMENVTYNLSLTDLSVFPDNHFDLIICSHVLEHIEADNLAARELFRVASPGSVSLMLVPINTSLEHNLEIPIGDDPELRWKYYGQDDHVRLYSQNGFVNLLKGVGYEVQLFKPNKQSLELNHELSEYGISDKSVLYVARKK